MVRILILTSRLPYPPNRGDRSRVFHFIKNLSPEHDLTLLSFIAHESEHDHLASLRSYCQDVRVVSQSQYHSALSVLLNLWHPEPLQTLYYRSGAMRRLVDGVLTTEHYDLVYIHLFRMAPYVTHRTDLYRVVDLTDAISLEIRRSLPYRGLAWRIIYRFEGPRIERYERQVAETFEETWMVSEADRQVLAEVCPEANVQVVPIGVDGQRFYPTGQSCKPNSLIFVGHMSVFHNVDAVTHLVQDVLPLVWQQIPDCTLEIIGADPNAQVRRLADNPAVTVTGFVPDLNAYLNRAAVFAAPLRFCAGVQTKVLEAMATARPVVTTSVVNRGVGAQPDRDILIADDAETAANHITALLKDPDLRMKIGSAGSRYVQNTFSWQHVAKRMRAIESIIGAEPASDQIRMHRESG